MAESQIDKLVAQHEAICQMAIDDTPEKYRKYLTFPSRNMKVGGNSNLYANVRYPFMTFNGSVKMARDDHAAKEATLCISPPEFTTINNKLVARVEAISSIYGSASGICTVEEFKAGQRGPDKTLEKAESGAIRRALRNLGYGIYGLTLPDDEELDVETEQPSYDIPQGDRQEPPLPTTDMMATDKQMGLLYAKMSEFGFQEGDKREFIKVYFPDGLTKAQCSPVLDAMTKQDKLPIAWLKAYMDFLMRKQSVPQDVVKACWEEWFGTTRPSEFTKPECNQLFGWLATYKPESIPVYNPSKPTMEQWAGLVGGLVDPGNISKGDVERWMVSNYTKTGKFQDLDGSAYSMIIAMDVDKVHEAVTAFLRDNEQAEMDISY